MAKTRIIFPKHQISNRQSRYYLLNHEKLGLESHYDFLECKIKTIKGRLALVILGKYSQTGIDYSYKVIYYGDIPPKVWILTPDLVRDPPHVYKDKSLCLYYPKEQPWKYGYSSIYSHIIPWVHEWILFYEIWKITGVWEHPEVNHGVLPKL